ncbi:MULTISPECIES: gamma-glutamylcyclotransferase [Bordetella]|uniref:glutathione-specific gamma-glutamylcyclotransferase n=1 Tax=Bordetella genomosp. 6 TaxID=463024 RepID=A0ABX4FI88_9BORD|nr:MULTISPECIES: gamma-glutamylcyclotransferase [Bordetella]ARP75477.1 gamma-glutamylcyclotransferase [Bordetella genomosp. 6]KCV66497.1 ChaC-like protein [Bordetella bronchiseptica 99-R-0433]MBN3266439.1 gamma-glutamylcyclotransferase [Bordetella bronchiseptica]OZI80952.1 gamma-glutamylcyclotransferase [Bordetella genomosp. 6]
MNTQSAPSPHDPHGAAALPFRLWTAEERRASLDTALREWRAGEDVWVYGYGSLIWRPDFDFLERRLATLHGHHRALCLWSRVNRGTPECPGLVFGLDRGGSCRGVVYRLAGRQVPDYFPALWDREMSTGAYLPRWLRCATEHGPVNALVFIMNRANPAYIRALPEPELLAIVRRASGRYGPCTEYVVQTAQALRQAGIRDARLEQIARKLEADVHPLGV